MMCADQSCQPPTTPSKTVCQNGAEPLTIDITIDINDIYDGALKVLKRVKPFWPINNVKFKVFTDGTTNKLIGCCIPKNNDDEDISLEDDDNLYHYKVLLIRIYGKNTEVLIDRRKEITNFNLLHRYGFAPKLYATFSNGLVYEYTDGKPLSKTHVYEEHVWREIAKRMAEMHRDIQCDSSASANGLTAAGESAPAPVLWTKVRRFLDLVPETFADPAKQQRREALRLPTKSALKAEFEELSATVSKTQSPVVFAHNDLLLGNILYDERDEKKVIFIDYEYADYNYQAYDIGNHFAEFAGMTDIDFSLYPPKEYQLKWITEYLTHYHLNDTTSVTDEYVNKLYAAVNKYALIAHWFWMLWGLIQAEHSEIDYDYIEFASLKYNEYLARKEQFLSL